MQQDDFDVFQLNTLKEKLFQLNSRFEKNLIVILILAVVFLFLDNSLIREIEFSGIKLNDINYLIVIIPPLFGFFQLHNYTLASEINRIIDEIVQISKRFHSSEDTDESEINFRLLLSPISIIHEFVSGLLSKKVGLILVSFLVYLPALILMIIFPYIFLIYSLYRLTHSTFPEKPFVIVSLIVTSWFLVAILVSFIMTTYEPKDK